MSDAEDPRPDAPDQQRLRTRREAMAQERAAEASPGESDGDRGGRQRTTPGPNPEPEDSGTREQSWLRLKSALVPRLGRSQLLAAILCALLGFALVAQIQHTEDSGLATLSERQLVRVLDDVDDRNERLEAEAAQLARDEEELQSGSNQREAARQQAQNRAEALSVLAGTVPVTGPGVELRIAGSPGTITSTNLVALVQELRDAGAEAIEINGVRIVVDTYFTEGSRGDLFINDEPVSLPITITAIGDSETLATAMRIPGGVGDTIEQRGGEFTVTAHDAVDIDSVVPQVTEE
ncbi:DUF881 domain-containing protein [Brevibacterium daeguense]|uniref:DUF881 domain-containing protein n=1 Tax=Brevibacterium daeguense TaxID=909936 RepID=A0ABP8EMR5_9MICO|nr:DUF881 domain-containing protein [Brevibacterium daeguense]